MRVLNLRSLLVTFVVLGAPAVTAAQRPTPAQMQQMLQDNPALLQQLRQRLVTSGMTPDQVRARLRAEGYPENILDPYLTGDLNDSTSKANKDVFAAVRKLNVSDSIRVKDLRCSTDSTTPAAKAAQQ